MDVDRNISYEFVDMTSRKSAKLGWLRCVLVQQVFNRQLRIYGNSLPGHRDASVDGGHLLKVVDRVVARKHNRLALEVGHQLVEWRIRRNRKRYIKSRFLYDIRRVGNGAGDASTNQTGGILFVAFNRVIAGNFRSGSGLCRADVTLYPDQGTQNT